MVSADTLVLSVSATDRDSGLNGKITYRLLSSPLQGFYIKPDNGKKWKRHPELNINVSLTANRHCVSNTYILYIEKGEVKKSPEG